MFNTRLTFAVIGRSVLIIQNQIASANYDPRVDFILRKCARRVAIAESQIIRRDWNFNRLGATSQN
jgi:hypothetical protein